MSTPSPDEQRDASHDAWQAAAAGWGKRADEIREWGMPVSAAMIDGLDLQPGQRVLELAAGPGDTGFMAAELVAAGGGTLISSDGSPAMLDVARARAAQLGLANVEFASLELEWIELETATVDAVLCRWAIMLVVDPDAAAREIRRILRPGGRAAIAVWDELAANPWATIPGRVMVGRGHQPPPDPGAPGMFSLAPASRLTELLQDGGFTTVEVIRVALDRRFASIAEYIAQTADMSSTFRIYHELDQAEQAAVAEQIAELAAPYTGQDGSVVLPGSSLVAIASA